MVSKNSKWEKKITNPVGKLFFKYNIDKNESSCIIEGCHRSIKGRHSQNLETHIRSYHLEELEVLIKSKVQIQKIQVTENEKRQLEYPATQSKVNKIEFLFLIKYLNSIIF